ncbi:DUF2752 domain-containing protein [Pinibacter soli]|uniref:DUF2752 domain-containing protein n=1 Tax=Pinibacter soli TaxID=3044211 RepID=UPI003CE450C7
MLTCPSKKFLHIDCPGCGLQRSVIAMLKGDAIESFYLYPATVPLFLTIILLLLHLKCNFKYGAVALKSMYIFSAVIIFSFYTYKLVTLKFF